MIGLDSNIIIDVLRNKNFADKLNKLSDEDLCTSEIVVFEIFYGLYTSRNLSTEKIKEFEDFLEIFIYIFPIVRKASKYVSQIAGKLLKSGNMTKITDVLIAGNLLANSCKKFITKNIKDFHNIKELELIEI